MTKYLLALGALLALPTGCTKTTTCDTATGDGCTDTDTDTDSGGGDTDTDTNTHEFGPEDVTINWGDTAMTVSLTNVPADFSKGFWLGFAETASDNGWYGEDCYVNGTGSYQLCHYFLGTTGTATYTTQPAEVSDVDPQYTLFNATTGPGLTYFLDLDDGSEATDDPCYIWGDDPTYFATAYPQCVTW